MAMLFTDDIWCSVLQFIDLQEVYKAACTSCTLRVASHNPELQCRRYITLDPIRPRNFNAVLCECPKAVQIVLNLARNWLRVGQAVEVVSATAADVWRAATIYSIDTWSKESYTVNYDGTEENLCETEMRVPRGRIRRPDEPHIALAPEEPWVEPLLALTDLTQMRVLVLHGIEADNIPVQSVGGLLRRGLEVLDLSDLKGDSDAWLWRLILNEFLPTQQVPLGPR